jgi:hypothetical protein
MGSIYKLSSRQCEEVYIGSTQDTLKIRFQNHKASYKRNSGVLNSTSYKILQYDDCIITLIEEVDNIIDLKPMERYYIEISNCVNHNIPSRENKEYCRTYRQRLNEYGINYYNNNKTLVSAKSKQRYQLKKEIKNLMRINVN